MNRREFLKKTAAMATGAIITNQILDLRFGTNRVPNIVFFFIDDLGWYDVGFMGSTYYETPNIDRLATEGMVFTDAYANAANCLPTRACLMSGKYPPRHGVYTVWKSDRRPDNKRKVIPTPNTTSLATEFVTFAEVLQQNGYATASMGKWHCGGSADTLPTGQGFDINIGGSAAGAPPKYFSPYNIPNLTNGPSGEYLTDRLTEEAMDFIETNKDNPFLLYLTHFAIHEPIQAKQDLIDKYAAKPPSQGQDHATYAAMIESVDDSVKAVLDKLEELDLTNDTFIVFTSDNGGHGCYTSHGPLRGSKGMFYEGGIREPFIVKWPGKVQPGSTCGEPIILTDLFPTFLDVAKITKPQDLVLDGESLIPLITQTGSLQREAIFWHFPAYLQRYGGCMDFIWRAEPQSIIRKGKWKLIELFEPDPEPFTYELYDLENDIGETTNLADINTAKRDELIADLHAWQQATNAPICTEPDPNYDPDAPPEGWDW